MCVLFSAVSEPHHILSCTAFILPIYPYLLKGYFRRMCDFKYMLSTPYDHIPLDVGKL